MAKGSKKERKRGIVVSLLSMMLFLLVSYSERKRRMVLLGDRGGDMGTREKQTKE